MTIEWKVIDKFKNYAVSTNGEVKNIKTGRILKPYDNGTGYCKVDLYNGGIKSKCRIHRLVAEAFIPNPDNKPTVDHIDRNPKNNTVENLRWATQEEQNDNSGTQRKVIIAAKDGIEHVFDSQGSCARELGLSGSNINSCLRGRLKTHKGYTFRYLERSEVNAN